MQTSCADHSLVAVAADRFGVLRVHATIAEDMRRAMHRAQPSSVRFRPSGESVSKAAYMLANSVSPPVVRHLARQQDRADRRLLVVAVVGVPAAADIGCLLRLLAHLGDLRIAVDRGEEAVDVDRRQARGEGDMLLRRQRLVAEEDDAVSPKARRISAKVASGSGAARSTPAISAPTWVETGSTRMCWYAMRPSGKRRSGPKFVPAGWRRLDTLFRLATEPFDAPRSPDITCRPGRHSGARHRREPGIHRHKPLELDSGFTAARRRGMTAGQVLKYALTGPAGFRPGG